MPPDNARRPRPDSTGAGNAVDHSQQTPPTLPAPAHERTGCPCGCLAGAGHRDATTRLAEARERDRAARRRHREFIAYEDRLTYWLNVILDGAAAAPSPAECRCQRAHWAAAGLFACPCRGEVTDTRQEAA